MIASVTLVLNLITLIVTVAAAKRRRILSYKLLVVLAIAAVGGALWTVLSGEESIGVLCITWALSIAMSVRIAFNLRSVKRKIRQ